MISAEFRVGDAMAKGFAIWFKNLPAFTVLAVLVYSPIILYTGVTLAGDLDVAAIWRWWYVQICGGFLLDLVVTAAVLYGTIEQLRGRRAGIGESIGVGIKRLLPVLGVGLLSLLCISGGGFLLLIGSVVVYCMLYLAVPVAVVERPGVLASLKRSRELTSGHKGAILGIFIVLFIFNVIVNKIVETVFITEHPTVADVKAYLWTVLAVGILIGALKAAVNGVVYHDLRVAKDGVATEDLARVFE